MGGRFMPSLQDGAAFGAYLSTGFTRGYYRPAPLGRATVAQDTEARLGLSCWLLVSWQGIGSLWGTLIVRRYFIVSSRRENAPR